jgi:hypothetical protein
VFDGKIGLPCLCRAEPDREISNLSFRLKLGPVKDSPTVEYGGMTHLLQKY